jgi:hypothetical protein
LALEDITACAFKRDSKLISPPRLLLDVFWASVRRHVTSC